MRTSIVMLSLCLAACGATEQSQSVENQSAMSWSRVGSLCSTSPRTCSGTFGASVSRSSCTIAL